MIKKILLSGTLLLAVVGTAFSADEKLKVVGWDIYLPASKWEIGFSGGQATSAIVEYVPIGENVTSWTELVTVQIARVPSNFNLSSFITNTHLGLQKGCESLKWNVLYESKDEVIYEWNHDGCQGFPKTHELSRVMYKQPAVHRVAYAKKHSDIPERNREEWVAWLKNAKPSHK